MEEFTPFRLTGNKSGPAIDDLLSFTDIDGRRRNLRYVHRAAHVSFVPVYRRALVSLEKRDFHRSDSMSMMPVFLVNLGRAMS